ncbi:MAG: hypothetical protein IJZ46_00695 [Bacilli bacterium]|nr:hypothetical protein [Bacilli bacterium]
MKKIIVLLLLVLCLTGCGKDNTELIIDKEVEVNNKISDTENVSVENIKESVLYIKDNINNTKEKSVLEKLAYHANYLVAIGSKTEKTKNHELTTLGQNTLTYITKLDKKEKSSVTKLLTYIDEDEEKLAEELYNNYHKSITVTNAIKKAEMEVAANLVDSKKLNVSNITKAIEYISTYINDPFKNSEVTEKIVYYSEYLLQVGTKNPENEISLLGKYTKEYLKNLDNDNKKKTLDTLNNINKERKDKIESFYQSVK